MLYTVKKVLESLWNLCHTKNNQGIFFSDESAEENCGKWDIIKIYKLNYSTFQGIKI